MSQTREPPPRQILRQNNNLPDEIVSDILARLPVKSVLRCRCVSKTWYFFIATPNFISRHLIYHKNNYNLAYLINIPRTIASPLNFTSSIGGHDHPSYIDGCDHKFNMISKYPIPSDIFLPFVLSAGSYNGLVCLCQFKDANTKVDSIYLWNPSIRKFKRLPNYSLTHGHRVSTGFAYQSETNDYMVVNIYRMPAPNHRGLQIEAEVYTLSSNSWREIIMSLTNNIVVSPFTNNNSTFVRGALHWLGSISAAASPNMILSFDVNNDKFGEIALPDGQQLLPGLVARPNRLMVYKEELAFITLGYDRIGNINDNEYRDFMSSRTDNSCYIWAMTEYGVHDSWSKLFFVEFGNVDKVHIFGCTIRGELLVRKDERGRQVTVLCDLETRHEKDLAFPNAPHIANSFMESLVLLD